ncbi:hypothetical protein AU490_05815 [Lonsdalea populi]|nr:hypothetical protein AU489_03060 [Lonsdalea populi]RAT29673.1 hypothetical protein AU490_05815 [Lonsdalea populi]RAT33837.1 hypothetical protein AU493_14120 [Lonsdalea populi]RAT34279.1 hypothetical protein AU492_09020 [Lonsdalea populi]RAT42223.1 hypothetical protein AU495_12555 [Lonsdalea populi]
MVIFALWFRLVVIFWQTTPSDITLYFHINGMDLMKKIYFLHPMINYRFPPSPYPIWLAMIKPLKIFKITLNWTRDDHTRHREEKRNFSGPLIMRSRRWKYFANGEFYWLYCRCQRQGADGLTPDGEAVMTDALRKWAQGHRLPNKSAIRRAEEFHG